MTFILKESGNFTKSISKSETQQVIEFLKVFVDLCHHAKAEEVLFPVLEAAGISKARAFCIGTMPWIFLFPWCTNKNVLIYGI
jgi:hemerythrin-like domain-containing protein